MLAIDNTSLHVHFFVAVMRLRAALTARFDGLLRPSMSSIHDAESRKEKMVWERRTAMGNS